MSFPAKCNTPARCNTAASCSGRDGSFPAKCSNPAGCSGRDGSQHISRFLQRVRVPLRPCRVTNSEKEMRDPREPFAYDESMVNLGPQYQVYDPEKGSLSQRVDKTFVEAIFSDEINVDDTNYWFTEPEGGWNQKDLYAFKAPEVLGTPISADHFSPGRTELTDLREGTVMTGEVVSLMFYHGVQVDIGAQFDGLIPVQNEHQWGDDHWRSKWAVCTGVADKFSLGQQVTVRIHRINHRARCRWPIQLVVLDPDVQHRLTPPDEWEPPFDLRGVKSWDEAVQLTGRNYDIQAPPNWLSEQQVFDKQLKLKSKTATTLSYGQKPVNFDGLRFTTDIFEVLEQSKLQLQQRVPADVSEDEEQYYERYAPV